MLRLPAGEFSVPGITVVRMDMPFGLFQIADQDFLLFVTVVRMLMVFAFLQTADQITFPGITVIRMRMPYAPCFLPDRRSVPVPRYNRHPYADVLPDRSKYALST